MPYSIIIPIYNEEKTLPRLLKELKPFSIENELIFINDGSTDLSKKILSNCNYIKLFSFKRNHGKGVAIKTGLQKTSNEKIIITDGDLELDTKELKKLI